MYAVDDCGVSERASERGNGTSGRSVHRKGTKFCLGSQTRAGKQAGVGEAGGGASAARQQGGRVGGRVCQAAQQCAAPVAACPPDLIAPTSSHLPPPSPPPPSHIASLTILTSVSRLCTHRDLISL